MKKVFLLSVIILLSSCGNGKKKPEDIYSEEEMIEILTEVRILEGQVATLPLGSDSAKVLYYFLEKRLFEENGYDSLKYAKSNDYYLTSPEDYLIITSAVVDSVKLKKQQITTPFTDTSR